MITTLLIITIFVLIGIVVKQRLIIWKSQEKSKQLKNSYNELYNLTQEQKQQLEVLKRLIVA